MRPKYFFIFPLIVSTSVFVGGIIYLSNQFAGFFELKNPILLYIIFSSLIVIMFSGIRLFRNSIGKFGTIFYSLSTLLMGILLYLILSVFIVDLIALFIKIKPEILGISAILSASAITIYGILNALNIRITKLEIEAKGITKEVKIIQLSDIHIGHFRGKKFFQKIIDKTIKQNPDFVVITGDLYDGKKYLSKEFLEPLQQIKAPIFFIEGNHDIHAGIDEITNYLKQLNVTVLENEIYQIGEVQLIGLKYMKADEKAFDIMVEEKENTIKSVLSTMDISDEKASVLLHHSPAGINYVSEKEIDLYLAGHTHAGQIFPMTIINKWIFKYNKGLHEINGTKFFISDGIGSSRPPMRIGTKSEIVEITLKQKK